MTNEGRLPDGTLEFDKARILDIRCPSYRNASTLFSFLTTYRPKEEGRREESAENLDCLGIGFAEDDKKGLTIRGEGTWLEVEEALSALREGEEDGDLDFAFDTWTGSPSDFNYFREGRP